MSRFRIAGAFLSAAVLPLLLARPVAAATTLNVPAAYPTIQSAIDAASNGDTVLVAPGTYVENLDFRGRLIMVMSSQGPATTTIDGGQKGPVVNFSTGETAGAVLQGFTIQHGFATFASQYMGGGVRIASASPVVRGNVITANTACGNGAGVSIYFGSATLQDNTISNNAKQAGCSGDSGGGVNVQGAGQAQIVHNQITGNSSDFGGGVALFAAGTPTLINNTISNNSATTQGGGLYAVNQSDANLVQNLVTGNTAGSGGGLYIAPPSGTRGGWLTNNTLVGNSASDSGLVLAGFDAQVQLSNNIVVGAGTQPAVICDTTYSTLSPVLDHDDFVGGLQGSCAQAVGTNGNIAADPAFVAGGDYHLQAGSPAIDAGNNGAPNLPATDLDGRPRLSGSAVDLGVYEFQQPLVLKMGTVSGAVEGATFAAVLAHFSGGVGPYSATVAWGDGSSSAATISTANGNAVVASHSYAEEGGYTLSVTMTDATGASVAGSTSTAVADAALSVAGTTLSERRRTAFSAVVATLTDADAGGVAGDYSAQISWGDGQSSAGTVSPQGAAFAITGTHRYSAKGTYTVTVIGTDVGGASGKTTGRVTVS